VVKQSVTNPMYKFCLRRLSASWKQVPPGDEDNLLNCSIEASDHNTVTVGRFTLTKQSQ